jgi:hypothetical protein
VQTIENTPQKSFPEFADDFHHSAHNVCMSAITESARKPGQGIPSGPLSGWTQNGDDHRILISDPGFWNVLGPKADKSAPKSLSWTILASISDVFKHLE